MEDIFIPYTEAMRLHYLGFYEKCIARINNIDAIHIKGTRSAPSGAMVYDCVECPTWEQAFNWFREKHNLFGKVDYLLNGYYCFTINDMKNTEESNRLFTEYPTYKEARQACLMKLIKIIEVNT